jgi:transposase-like protein
MAGDKGAALLREDAKASGQSVDEYARLHDIDPALLYDGRIRKAREGERAAHEKQIDAELAHRPGSARRARDLDRLGQHMLGESTEPAQKRVRFSLAYAVRILLAVRRYGGVPGWIRATGQHERTAQWRYARARTVVRDAVPGVWAVVEAAYPAPKQGRPKSATRPVYLREADPPQPQPLASPSVMASDGASEDTDLLPEPRPCHARTRPTRRHSRTPKGERAHV